MRQRHHTQQRVVQLVISIPVTASTIRIAVSLEQCVMMATAGQDPQPQNSHLQQQTQLRDVWSQENTVATMTILTAVSGTTPV